MISFFRTDNASKTFTLDNRRRSPDYKSLLEDDGKQDPSAVRMENLAGVIRTEAVHSFHLDVRESSKRENIHATDNPTPTYQIISAPVAGYSSPPSFL